MIKFIMIVVTILLLTGCKTDSSFQQQNFTEWQTEMGLCSDITDEYETFEDAPKSLQGLQEECEQLTDEAHRDRWQAQY